MEVRWTEDQLKAIELRGSNILVAAAAGSGKTAVLVERIIRRICDKEKPVAINRLLVLTFTEAAASEMKRKIATAIEKKLKEEPENEWLKEQSILVHSAHISTIHAFCKSMLQSYIHKTDLPVDFSLIDATENVVLKNQALDAVLESYYQRINKKTDFRELVMGYGGTKSDGTLRELILKLYDFTKSLAYPEKWLHNIGKEYKKVEEEYAIFSTMWEEILVTSSRELIEEIIDGLEQIWKIVDAEVPSDHDYFAYYKDLLEDMKAYYGTFLKGKGSTTSLIVKSEMLELPRAPRKTGLDEGVVNAINQIKDQLVKKAMAELKDLAYCADEKIDRVAFCSPRIQVLKQLVRQTERLHRRLKREESMLDFNDLEHEMIKLLSDKKGNPTDVALELREQFEEILVDEYQDTNNIQDTIFRLISRDEKNIFMVGDLKQSIYRFRNANPGIFADKYKRYSQGDGGVCVRLFKNFRSRKEVVDAVNGIFSSIMTEKTGGLDYTEEEFLINGAEYEDGAGNFVPEILLTDVDKDKETLYGLTSAHQEGIVVAKRIRAMLDNKELMVKDSESGELRPVRAGDISILVRNKGKVAELEESLAKYGISSVSEIGEKYLDSLEVLTVLSFLQIIDNPRQDIPLVAVLRSAMFNFTPDELAEIRDNKKTNFYDDLKASAERGNNRCAEFLSILEKFRDDATHTGVDALIWRICHELNFMDLVGAMPNGRVRQENLNYLYERGAEFEKGAFSGLFRFMEYIEKLRESNADIGAENTISDLKNAVSIVTIHKSKGLEYPVVILCNMDSEFNDRDASNPIIWHESAGIGMDYVDINLRIKYPNLIKQIIKEKMIKDSREEDMRLLYVALTRAKEKLILSAPIGTHHDSWKKSAACCYETIPAGVIRRLRSTRNWVLSAMIAHPSAELLRRIAEVYPKLNYKMDFPIHIGRFSASLESEENTAETVTEEKQEIKLADDVVERISYKYPYENLGDTPIKLSISEVKRRTAPETDFVPEIPRLKKMMLTEDSEIGAAERGTITHFVMQHIDYERTDTIEEVEKQLSEMVERGLISEKQREAVSGQDIFGFFKKPLGMRLKAAEKKEREFDFYMEVPADSVMENLSDEEKDEKILLQGIADCFFYEDDGIVLIDYKTDRISEEEAEERAKLYKTQIEYYSKGLKDVLEMPIKERFLYFLNCGQAVSI